MAEKKFNIRYATQGGSQVMSEADKIAARIKQTFYGVTLSQKSAAESASVFEQALRDEERAFDELRASVDPTYAATRRYEAAVEAATRAVRQGAATQEQANLVIQQARARLDTFGGVIAAGGRGMNAYRGNIQNAAYQIGDFAVQVGAGTSASQALSQQLPQLLGSFGLAGIVAGAAAAVAIPLARWFFDSGEGAASAADAVKELESAISRLDEANQVYSTQGLQDIIDKYGELNAEILLLIERQQQWAQDNAFLKAKDAAASLKGEVSGVLSYLELYNAYISADQSDPANLVQAQDYAQALQEEFGLTILQAQALELALNSALRTDDAEVMSSAISSISGALEDSTFKGSEFAGTLLDAESALRALNAEAGGIGGWLGAAISGTATWAAGLWDAAEAARAAALASTSRSMTGTADAANTAAAGGPAGGPAYVPPPPMTRPQPRPADIDFGYTVPSTSGGGSTGGGGGSDPFSGGKSPWFDEEQEQQIIDAAKAVTEAQNAYTASVEKGADAVANLFMSFTEGADAARDALASLLAQMAEVALQQAVLGLADMGGPTGQVFGALGSALGTNAVGTDYWKGGPTWVGERGPEIINLPRGSSVMNAANSSKAVTGGTTNVYNIDARGAQTGVADQIAKALEAYDRNKYANGRAVSGDKRRVS
jgi:hypothetical protein